MTCAGSDPLISFPLLPIPYFFSVLLCSAALPILLSSGSSSSGLLSPNLLLSMPLCYRSPLLSFHVVSFSFSLMPSEPALGRMRPHCRVD